MTSSSSSDPRADLLALAPESLAALSNLGLVKRAQRMLATGHGPVTEVDEAGVVSGHFERRDVTCRIPVGPLASADCDCGAIGVCYHSVATVLAFRGRQAGPVADVAGGEQWSPGDFDDKAVAALVTRLGMARTRRLLSGGLVVSVAYEGGEPVARLPSCTVRFLVPNDMAYARCDCEISVGCEHLPIAVWAFREAEGPFPDTVELAATGQVDLEPLEVARGVARELLWTGVVGATEGLDAELVRAQKTLEQAAQTWPLSLIEDLQQALADYRARSARYRAGAVAAHAAGLEARWRAASLGDGAMPASVVLGTAEANDAPMDQVRLMSLGARRVTEQQADIYLVDLDTSNVSVLTALDRSDVCAERLAAGQIVTQAAKRRANRQLSVQSRRGSKTSVTPDSADWSSIRSPLLVTDMEALAQRWATRPPALLRPRVLAENVVVVPVEEVYNLRWAPGEQALAATATLPNGGGSLEIVRTYSGMAPGAVAALAELFGGDDTGTRIRFISGEIQQTSAGFNIDPLAVMTPSGLVVPDLAQAKSFEAEVGMLGSEADALGAAVDDALNALSDGVHRGLLGASASWLSRLDECSKNLEQHGLKRLGTLTRQCAESVEAVRLGGRSANTHAPDLWLEAYIHLLVAREQVES